MTHVQNSRPVRRAVTTARGEPLVLAVTPEGLWLREPRRRTAYLLPYGVAFQTAVRLEVDRQRREKAAARKAKQAATRARYAR